MTEPSASAAGWLAGSATIGAIFGLQPDMLIPGMLGGLVALSFAAPTSRMRMALSVFTSTVLAAYFAPVAAILAVDWMPVLSKAGDMALRSMCACAIGVFAQSLVPIGLRLLKSRAGVPQ